MKHHAAPILAAILLLLPILYVGSYFALVVPGGYMNGRLNISSTQRLPNYRAGNHWAKTAYWPLEQIDRRVRPRAWAESLFQFVTPKISIIEEQEERLGIDFEEQPNTTR